MIVARIIDARSKVATARALIPRAPCPPTVTFLTWAGSTKASFASIAPIVIKDGVFEGYFGLAA